MRSLWLVAGQTFRECRRRRVFLIIPVATAGFFALYSLGVYYAFRTTGGVVNLGAGLVDARALTGASLLGLAMFVILFLGSALGIFLTFTTVRGDAEHGLVQPVVVRPIARHGVLLGRFVGAGIVCVGYVLTLYAGAVLITGLRGSWWPDPLIVPGIELALGVLVVIALSLLGSVFLTSIANGIGMFMIYGAGLLAGLLGQLGDVLGSPGLERTGVIATWALPFEALYQSGLDSLTAGATGLTRVIVQLGPLGGARPAGAGLLLWVAAYVAGALGIAILAFRRRDL